MIPEGDILHRIEKEHTKEYIKNQIIKKPNRRSEKGKLGSQRNTNIKTWYK